MNQKELIQQWLRYKPKETPTKSTKINNKKVIIKDESKNITGTYKAKHGWMMGLDYLINHFPNKFTYYIGSTGNAAMGDFAYADILNNLLGEELVRVVCFYPLHYDNKVLGPNSEGKTITGFDVRKKLESFKSGKVLQVDFKEKYWFDDFQNNYTPCLDLMNEKGLKVNRNNSKDITEGFQPTYKQVMEEFAIQIKNQYGKIPRTLAIIQFGAGMLYDDVKEVIEENNYSIDVIAVSTGNINTIADKICDSSESWQENIRDLMKKGFTLAKNSGDKIYHLSENEIRKGLQICRKINIEAEPSGAASLGFIDRINETIKKEYDLIAIINTGDGIKNSLFN